MSNTDHWKRLTTTKTLHSIVKVSLLFAIGAGCGSAPDATLSAETYDEYTEPLTNAVIGEGNKTIVIGPAEATAPPAPDARVIPGVAGLDAGRGTGGSGGGSVEDTGGKATGTGGGGVVPDGGIGGAAGGRGGGFGPSGFWHFDDCSPRSHFLLDSSGNGFNAQHPLNRSCVPGISGLGVKFSNQND